MQKYVGIRIPSSLRRSSALAQERGNASVVGGTNSNRPPVAWWSDEETREEEEEEKTGGGKRNGGEGFRRDPKHFCRSDMGKRVSLLIMREELGG